MNRSFPQGGPNIVLLFMRAPELGKVKTRLTPRLSPAAALGLYKSMVADTLRTVSSAGFEAMVYAFPPDAVDKVAEWLGRRYAILPQQGLGLGERMADAFRRTFASGRLRAVLVGSDIPDLPAAIYRNAFDALGDHPAVIGPALDGGYYLIGFNRSTFLPEIFEHMAWGTHTVFERTQQRFACRGIKPHILPPWQDLDTYEDLVALAGKRDTTATLTRAELRRAGIVRLVKKADSWRRGKSD